MSKKKKKNSNGEGSVYKDRNGYRGQIVVGIDKMGEPIRRSVSGNTKQEVNEKLTQIKYSMITGTYVSPECITLPQLTRQMLEDDLNMNFIRESSYYRHIETLKRIEANDYMNTTPISCRNCLGSFADLPLKPKRLFLVLRMVCLFAQTVPSVVLFLPSFPYWVPICQIA